MIYDPAEDSLLLKKTNFDEKVFQLTKQIPKGRVSTYKIIAEKLGTRAYRAVGNALRKNKNPIIIPCHRVINNNGAIGGYSGIRESSKKIGLLRKEGITIKNRKIIGLKNRLYKF